MGERWARDLRERTIEREGGREREARMVDAGGRLCVLCLMR